MKKNKSLKAIVLSLGLAALVLPLDAQVINHGQQHLDREKISAEGLFNRGSRSDGGGYFIHPQTFFDGENYGYNLYNGTFEDVTPEVPLGSGLFIMAAAGAGYALKKRKDNKKQ